MKQSETGCCETNARNQTYKSEIPVLEQKAVFTFLLRSQCELQALTVQTKRQRRINMKALGTNEMNTQPELFWILFFLYCSLLKIKRMHKNQEYYWSRSVFALVYKMRT
jgi:hypothetical protein